MSLRSHSKDYWIQLKILNFGIFHSLQPGSDADKMENKDASPTPALQSPQCCHLMAIGRTNRRRATYQAAKAVFVESPDGCFTLFVHSSISSIILLLQEGCLVLIKLYQVGKQRKLDINIVNTPLLLLDKVTDNL